MTEIRELPRRCYVDLWTPAEAKIAQAIEAVESIGCDTRLTEAVILLGQAKEKVADYVDRGRAEPKSPALPEKP